MNAAPTKEEKTRASDAILWPKRNRNREIEKPMQTQQEAIKQIPLGASAIRRLNGGFIPTQ
jgi:hypothetical protein